MPDESMRKLECRLQPRKASSVPVFAGCSLTLKPSLWIVMEFEAHSTVNTITGYRTVAVVYSSVN